MTVKRKFTHYDLGNVSQGQIIEIILSGNAANVQLLNSNNFNNYKNGRKYRYFGGLAKRSPVRLQIPTSGHWHVAVDMRGLRGSVKSSIRILPNPLPVIKDVPLSSIPSLVNRMPLDQEEDFNPEYDVFVSHASEDKEEIVRPLANALKKSGKLIFTTLNGLFPLYHSVEKFHSSTTDEGNTTCRSNTFNLMAFRDYNITTVEDDFGIKKELECNERYYVPSEITWLLKTLNFKRINIYGAKLGVFSRKDKLTTEDFEMLVIADFVSKI